MTIVNFTPYQSHSGNIVCVIVERITHFYDINYNGNIGTCIVLDTGKEIKVEHSRCDVECVIRKALEETK